MFAGTLVVNLMPPHDELVVWLEVVNLIKACFVEIHRRLLMAFVMSSEL